MNAVERAVFEHNNKDPSADVGYTVMMDDQKSQIGAQEVEDEAKEEFARKYAKLRPLKTLNLVLMCLVTSMLVANALAPSSFQLDWSKCWQRMNFDPDRSCFNPGKLAIGQTVLLALSAGILHAMMRKAKNASKLSHLALKDIWFALLFIANLTLIAIIYGGRSFAEIRWFGTKLRANETLEELTEWGTESDAYRYTNRFPHNNNNFNHNTYYNHHWNATTTTTTIRPPWGWDKWDTERMELRKALIKTRLVFDPSLWALAMLAIVLQVVFLCRTILALKRSKTSAAGSIYPATTAQPNFSALAKTYARFWPLGLLKMALVFIPMAIVFLSFYMHYGFYSSVFNTFKGPITFSLISMVCLCHWVCYVEKVRFHGAGQKDGEDNSEEEKIVQFCKKDCKFSALAIIVLGFLYLFVFCEHWRDIFYQHVLLIMAGLFASSLLYNLCLLKRHGDGKGGAGKCGGISVKLNFQFQMNVGKNNDVKPEQASSNVGIGQVEEEKEMEKKKPLSLEDVV